MSEVNPLFESLIKPIRPGCEFVFYGIKGSVDTTGYVFWDGMTFHLESCGLALRKTIDAAMKEQTSITVSQPLIEQAISMLAAAAEQIDIGRPPSLGVSPLAAQMLGTSRRLRSCMTNQ